jgi:glutamate-1-semialdehyde aminotransferase
LAGYGGITTEIQTQIDGLADNLSTRVNALFNRLRVGAQMIRAGSLFNIHFTDEPISNYRTVMQGDRTALQFLSLALMNRGILIASRGMGCTASVMTSREVDDFLTALEGAIIEDLELGH